MKTLVLALFCCFSFSSFSQIWIAPNAVWHYDFWNIAMGGFYRLEYVQDTVVGGMSSQQIDIYRYAFGQSGPGGPIVQLGNPSVYSEFTRVSGDTVFRWDGNQYHTLFNFGAQPGDTWIISTEAPAWSDPVCGDTSRVIVTAVGTELINGNTYRYIELDYVIGSPTLLTGHFNERFGGDAPFIFPGYATCDSMLIAELDMRTFKCFEDDLFSLYNPSGEDCEYLLTHLGLQNEASTVLSLAPNPASESISITGVKAEEVEIVGLNGTIVLLDMSDQDSDKIDISALSPGVYYVQVSVEGHIYRQRFVKQ